MPLVSMRQLLDHAAEHGYGLPAFNVNNLEQVQAIMEAAERDRQPGDHAGLGRRAQVRRRDLPAPPDRGRDRDLSRHARSSCTRTTASRPAVCKSAMQLGFSSVMMDGSLQEDGKTIADYEYNVDVTRKVVDDGARDRRHRRGRARLPRLARDHEGRQGRRPRRRRHDDARTAADRSRTRPPTSSRRRSSTRWPSPSAPRTAPTSSRASPPATSSRSTASRRSTRASPTRTW